MIANRFFSVISILFHPVFMPVLGLFLLFSIETKPTSFYKFDAIFYFPDKAKYYLYIVIGILTIIAPVLSLLIMYSNKMISSLNMKKREERYYPFALVTFYYILAYVYVRYQIPVEIQHPALLGFLFGILAVFIVSFILNIFVKVSMHSVGAFGVAGMLLGYSQTQLPANPEAAPTSLHLILYLLFIAGFVSGSRVFLKAHKLNEVIIGSFLGFIFLFVTVKYGIYF